MDQYLIENFKDMYLDEIDTKKKATNKCDQVSREFQEYCSFLGLNVGILTYEEYYIHVVNIYEGNVIDWTFRQFNPTSEIPFIMAQKEYGPMIKIILNNENIYD